MASEYGKSSRELVESVRALSSVRGAATADHSVRLVPDAPRTANIQTNASMPPATAAKRAAFSAPSGPNQAPAAAKSFTSPAPIMRKSHPGSQTTNPTLAPPSALIKPGPTGSEAVDTKTPSASTVRTSEFGIRRALISFTQATINRSRRVATATSSTGDLVKPRILRAYAGAHAGRDLRELYRDAAA